MQKINNPAIRSIAGIVLLLLLIFGYWWLTWVLAIIFFFLFEEYYEIIFCAILYDALYGVAPIFSGISIILFIIVFYMRKYISTYV